MNRRKGKFITSKRKHAYNLSSSRLQSYRSNTSTTAYEDNTVSETNSDTLFSDETISFSDESFCNVVEVETGESKKPSWEVGRRIVDLGHIIQQLKCCGSCDRELNIINIKSEKKYGYGSVFSVQCKCGALNKIDSNTRHVGDNGPGPQTFVVNTKAALGMIHSGVGHTHITNFMSTMGVPGLHHKRMKQLQSEVGDHVRSVAKESCRSALREEEYIVRNQSSTGTDETDGCQSAPCETVCFQQSGPIPQLDLVQTTAVNMPDRDTPDTSTSADQSIHHDKLQHSSPLISSTLDLDHSYAVIGSDSQEMSVDARRKSVSSEFKYDMGWQKRGSGRCYDSRSGVGTMIGNKTGKICAYGVRIKDCKVCSYHKSKGNAPRKHTCCKNWSGSSKVMEPDVGGELVKEIEKDNIEVGVIIMDDDCTTMARIRQELSHTIEKWSDQNHTVKHLGNSLYNMQKKHKVISTMVIKHIQKCFNYALAQNKGNVENFRQALKQITPHLFGEHDSCGDWCGYIKDPDNYKHHGLPHGRPLTGETLRSDLDSIISVFVRNAEKIAPRGSTKDVESFNNMIASKAPKRIHYSSSSSLINRVDCAVAQKNIGMSYVNKVNLSLGISPGKVFEEHAVKQDTLRKRRTEKENTLTFKRRRLERKFAQKKENAAKELREGTTYKTGVANAHISDVTEIPNPRVIPQCKPVSEESFSHSQKVFCDIETTSLSYDADIVQIAAVCGDDKFKQYIMPSKHIVPSASAVTGLSTHGHVLFYNGKPVDTLPLKEALQVFLAWLDTHHNCVLIGHNFKKFDFPRIVRAFEIAHLTNPFIQCVSGIVDTYSLFKTLFPDLEKYSQEFLVSVYLKEDYAAHNALGDVEILQKLCSTVGVLNNQMLISSYSIDSVLNLWNYNKDCKRNVESLMTLKDQNVLAKGMIDKIASSGLCLGHLKLAVSRSGLEGLEQLCKENVNGKPRVTKMKRIINALFDYLKD